MASLAALTALIQSSAQDSDHITYQLFTPLCQQIEATITPDLNAMSADMAKDAQENLTLCLQVVLVNLKNKISDQEINGVADLLIKIFQNLQRVSEYGLLALSGLCVGV
jgi:hypothetical protein